MQSRVVSATEFKAKCLALLDEIDHQGGTITVTKRGRPMAVVGPVRRRRLWKSPEGSWADKVDIREKVIRRMLDPQHATRTAKIQAALAALGKRLTVEIRDAA